MRISASNQSDDLTASQPNEYLELKKFIVWVLITMLPLIAISTIVSILSGSLAIFGMALDCGVSLIQHFFNLFAIIIILRQNCFSFPYGTGKLENFSGLLYAIIVIPISLLIMYSAFKRYLDPPATIDLGMAQIPVFLSIIRSGVLMVWVLRMCRRFSDHSPMTYSYFVSFKFAITQDLSIVAGLLIGLWVQSSGNIGAAIIFDLVIGVSVAIYMLYIAVGLLGKNFRSLIDLPLPEADQLKILNALTMDFDAYEGIGNIYSHLSGSCRYIQIEMHFDSATSAEEIELLRQRLEQRLRGSFNKLVFHLIPFVQKTSNAG